MVNLLSLSKEWRQPSQDRRLPVRPLCGSASTASIEARSPCSDTCLALAALCGDLYFPCGIIDFLQTDGARMAFVFGSMVLDAERRELRSGSTVLPIEPQVFDILEFLIRNRDRVVSKDDLVAAVWEGRIVSDSAIAARINAARRAIGDSGKQQRWIRTIPRKGFRFVGDVCEQKGSGAASSPAEATAEQFPDHGSRDQEITFCRTKDGINLAIGCAGEGMPLVRIFSWLTHLEFDWQNPIRGPLWHFLADRFRLIRYDGRGLGLSDRDVADISFAAMEHDLETVVDALNLRRYALLG
jgi:DNA-binding winged helix-turn-helix (wHTH) protein